MGSSCSRQEYRYQVADSRETSIVEGTSEQEDEEPEEDEDAGIYPDDGIYNAVANAAFGGVHICFDEDRKAKMHPFLLLVLCIPLFVAQVSSMLCIRLDMEVDTPVNDSGETGKLLLSLKILMVLTLQLMLFGYLLSTMRMMIFISNPLTWIDVKHPHARDWVAKKYTHTTCVLYLFKPWNIMPWCFLAMGMRLAIGYMVCVDSVSIILASTTATDTIFNSLAMTFILDLNTAYLEFCKAVFRIDNDGNYKIQAKAWEKPHLDQDGSTIMRLNPEFRRGVMAPRLFECLANNVPCLRRGFGARRLETAITFIGMCVIYSQQLFVLMHALDTDVLPLARDLCTWWRWEHRASEGGFDIGSHIALFLDESFSFIDVKRLTNNVVTRRLHNKCMSGEKYDRMRAADRTRIMAAYPGIVVGGIVGIVCIFIMPQLPHTRLRFATFFVDDDDDAEEEQDKKIESLEVKCHRQHKEILELRKRTQQLEDTFLRMDNEMKELRQIDTEMKALRKRDKYFA